MKKNLKKINNLAVSLETFILKEYKKKICLSLSGFV